MFIVQIASECAPVAKVGGLADVVYGLSRELEIRGHAVEIVLPKYDCLWYDQIWGLQPVLQDLWVPWHGGAVHASVYFGFVHGRKCFFIEPHSEDSFFDRGVFYGHYDDPLRFAFFCKAALEFLLKTNKRPDIIHAHDWQTALVPVLLYELFQHAGLDRQRVCYTIHNFRHQGSAGADLLAATGLGPAERFFVQERLQDPFNLAALNLMKGGIVYANAVSTVSPRHAWEVLNTDLDCGLGGALSTHREKFTGILNGLDTDAWNPAADPWLPAPFDADRLAGKDTCRQVLRQRLWLADSDAPLVAYVGRLDSQKGVHLIRHAVTYVRDRGAQMVLLGASPDPGVQADFQGLKRWLNDDPDCHIELGFDEALAHLIYAAADIIIVPSMYEPCGLTQLIGMRYGAVPVARAVGGLIDTVFDADHASVPRDQRNGFVFADVDFPALESALGRAIDCAMTDKARFQAIRRAGMRQDHSWNRPGDAYLRLYDSIRA